MKKFLSILLALALVLSLGTVAFATGGEELTDDTDMPEVKFTKNYKLASTDGTSPAETFEFENIQCTKVENAADGVDTQTAPKVTTISKPVFEAGAATANGTEKDVTITLPNYESVGIYTYTFNEKDNGTAGVVYDSDTITLKVYVTQQADGSLARTARLYNAEGDKIDTIENTYAAGSLTVEKIVTGNMGDRQKDFEVKVTFKANPSTTVKSEIAYGGNQTITPEDWNEGTATATITLKHGDAVTFSNIPYGVSYEIEETDYTGNNGGYDKPSYEGKNGTINGDTPEATATITNNKTVGVDTGVFMDSLPYVLLLVGACAGLVVFFARRRMTHKG